MTQKPTWAKLRTEVHVYPVFHSFTASREGLGSSSPRWSWNFTVFS